MLNAVESLVVVEHEEVLILLLFGHVPQPVQRIECPEIGSIACLWHRLILNRLIADQRNGLVLGIRALFVSFSEEILLILVENMFLLHELQSSLYLQLYQPITQ